MTIPETPAIVKHQHKVKVMKSKLLNQITPTIKVRKKSEPKDLENILSDVIPRINKTKIKNKLSEMKTQK